MLSATLLPTRSTSISPTTSTPSSPTLAPSLIPTTCPAGTSQGDGLTCPEGHVKSGFTTKGVCCKRAYTSVTSVPVPVTRPPTLTMGPSQAPMGPSQVPMGPSTPEVAQFQSRCATYGITREKYGTLWDDKCMEYEYTNKLGPFAPPDRDALLLPTFAPEPERKWLKPVLIGGGVLAALGIAALVIRR